MLRSLLKSTAFLVIFAAISLFLNRAFPLSNVVSLSMWDNYNQVQQPDTVFLGSSFAHEGLDTAAYDHVLGGRSVNMGTPAQTWDMCEIALDRVLSEGSAKHIVLIMDYHNMGDEEDRRVAGNFLYAELAMAPAARKISLAWQYLRQPDVLTSSDSLNFFFPWMVGEQPQAWGDLRRGLNPPQDKAAAIAELRYYNEQKRDVVVDFDNLGPGSTYVWSTGEMSDDAFAALGRICEKCNRSGVDMIVVCTPRPAADIVSYPDFYTLQARMTDFFAYYGIPYYDYSLAKPELFVSREPDYYRDIMHMNATGAAAFSESLAHLQQARLAGEDVGALFMAPSEYLAGIDRITNVSIATENHEEGILLIASAYCGTAVTPEYEFWAKAPGETDYTRFAGYTDRVWAMYETTEHGHYSFRVNARVIGSDKPFEHYHLVEVDY